ncbi:DUF3604 domain-containing protein [Planctomycetota bacterium]
MTLRAKIRKRKFEVGKPCNVVVEVRCTEELKTGDKVEFQFPNSWSLVSGPSFTREFQTEDPEASHYVQAEADGVEFSHTITERNLNFQETPGRHGRLITAAITNGILKPKVPIRLHYQNTIAPYVTETDHVWIRANGEYPKDPADLIVTPGPAVHTRVIVPSGVKPGEEFDVLIILLDRFDNRSSSLYEDIDLKLNTGETVAEAMTVDGFARVTVALAEEGVFRFIFGEAVSNAVCVSSESCGPWWGDIHMHTKLSGDAQGSDPYVYAREVSGLDFAGICDHCESLGLVGYSELVRQAEAFNAPGSFVTMYADERNPGPATGHHNMYFRDRETLQKYRVHEKIQEHLKAVDVTARLRVFASLNPDETEIAQKEIIEPLIETDPGIDKHDILEFPPEDVMLLPHHTGITWRRMPEKGIGAAVDYDALGDVPYRPVMEIYSHHGQSEVYDPQHVLAYELNRMRNPERRCNVSYPGPHYAQDYLMMGKRFGFIGSSDEHSGQGGRRHGGIAGVFAADLTRDGIFDGIRTRNCYATTGERILLDFNVNGTAMGQESSASKGDKVKLQLSVWGTDLLVRVEVLRFRFGVDEAFRPILSEAPRPESLDAEFEIEDTLEADTVYYARVVQGPLEWPGMAWSSPVWIQVEG